MGLLLLGQRDHLVIAQAAEPSRHDPLG